MAKNWTNAEVNALVEETRQEINKMLKSEDFTKGTQAGFPGVPPLQMSEGDSPSGERKGRTHGGEWASGETSVPAIETNKKGPKPEVTGGPNGGGVTSQDGEQASLAGKVTHGAEFKGGQTQVPAIETNKKGPKPEETNAPEGKHHATGGSNAGVEHSAISKGSSSMSKDSSSYSKDESSMSKDSSEGGSAPSSGGESSGSPDEDGGSDMAPQASAPAGAPAAGPSAPAPAEAGAASGAGDSLETLKAAYGQLSPETLPMHLQALTEVISAKLGGGMGAGSAPTSAAQPGLGAAPAPDMGGGAAPSMALSEKDWAAKLAKAEARIDALQKDSDTTASNVSKALEQLMKPRPQRKAITGKDMLPVAKSEPEVVDVMQLKKSELDKKLTDLARNPLTKSQDRALINSFYNHKIKVADLQVLFERK